MKFALLFFLFALTPALAQPSWSNMLKRFDQNNNQKLEEGELPAQLKANMPAVDTDRDGMVSQKEFEAASKNSRARRPEREVKIPEGVTLRRDIAYREGNPKWKLDLYLPKADAPEGGRPGLVVVHGGGWKGGDKRGGSWSAIPAEYAEAGYVAISVNYRLHPEVGMFDCIADVKCAVRWLRANAEEFGLDPERIGAYGNSAGAHLVSMLGLTDEHDGLEGDGPHGSFSSQVQAVCASATPSDFLQWGGSSRAGLPQLTDHVPEALSKLSIKKRATKASPLRQAGADAPAFLLVHAENDPVVPYDQGKRLADRLKELGGEVTFLSYKDGGHGVFGAKGKETRPAMKAFFEKSLQPK